MTPVVLLHGFSQEQTIALMRAVKKAAPENGVEASAIAFATSTPNNMEWKLKDLFKEVAEEHAYMTGAKKPDGNLA